MRGRATGNASRFPDKRMSKEQAHGQMMMLLYGCTPPALAGLTVDMLVGSYRVDRKSAEYELTVARQKRGAAA